jgi:hypothetical protein
MKKLLQKINTKTSRSVVLGLALSFLMMAGSSIAQPGGGLGGSVIDVIDINSPLIENGLSFIDRNGSFTIGSNLSPQWIRSDESNFPDCIISGQSVERRESCLDGGNAAFANLLINRSTFLRGATAVGSVLSGNNITSFPDGGSQFIVQDTLGGFDSILISGLSYGFDDSNQTISPRDLTTQQHVCADSEGILFRCVDSVTPSPITYEWVIGGWGECSDPANATCAGSYTSGNTNSISCAGPTTPSACENQDAICTFSPIGESIKERTITCVDSEGTAHSDQVCINNGAGEPEARTSTVGCDVTPAPLCGSANGTTGPKPSGSSLCDIGTASSVINDAYSSSGDPTSYSWSCTQGADSVSCSSQAAPICSSLELTQSNLTITENPAVTSPGSANGVFSIDFDDDMYENVSLFIKMAQGSVNTTSPISNNSPISSANYGDTLWDISISADCKSGGGTRRTSNTIQATGSTSATTSNACANPVWFDGTSFDWGGVGYRYFTPSRESINPNTNSQAACNGYVVNGSGSDATWYKYECVEPGSPNSANGNFFKYFTNNTQSIVYTDSLGAPLSSSVNDPSYETIGNPLNWISNNVRYTRFVPVSLAC